MPSLSPLTILTPSKPRLILTRIVWIEIDVQARYSAISKLEEVAETSARSFAPCPRLTRYSQRYPSRPRHGFLATPNASPLPASHQAESGALLDQSCLRFPAEASGRPYRLCPKI